MSGIAIKVVAAIAGLVVVIWLVTRLLDRGRQLRRALTGARQVAIRDAPSRRAGRIAGMVVPVGPRLIAPLSGRACVYYRVRVTQVRLSGTELETRGDILDASEIVPFAIDDGTGFALIDVSRTQMLLELDVDEHSGHAGRTPNQAALLAQHDVASRGVIFGKDLTFREWIVEVGERIAVAGAFIPEPAPSSAPDAPYREATATAAPTTPRVRLVASGGAVVITDDPELAPPLDEA